MKQIILRSKLTAPRPIVVSVDSAIDVDAPDFQDRWKRYTETYDLSLLEPFRPGCKPVIFWVGPLETIAQLKHVEDRMLTFRIGEAVLEHLAYAVRDIANLRDENGQDVKIERVKSDLGPRLPDEAMLLFADEDVRRQVYAHAKAMNQLHSEVRKSPPG